MKWKHFLTIIIVLLFPHKADSAVTAGDINVIVTSNTQVLVQITTLATEIDSVYIGRLVVTDSDTVFTVIDSTATLLSVNDLSPWANLEFIMIVRDTNGDTSLSVPDTVRIYAPELERNPNTTALLTTERMITATSWRPSITESFTVNGANLGDSSGVYIPFIRNAFTVVATQAGDSVKTMIYIHYGYRELTQKGDVIGFTAASESLNVTGIGVFGKTLTAGVTAPSMYFTTGGYVGNGKDASLTIDLTRDRY